jgi:hypothetical protein
MTVRLSTLLLFVFAASSYAAAPVLFYSDLLSGPKTGGEGGNGSYVTIYGKNFGSTQGTSSVTVGAGAATNYKIWTDTKVAFQLGSGAATGNIVLTTTAGSSNGLAFTVRTGNIYFASTTGNDSTGTGSFASPFRTIAKVKNTIAAGDIGYIENGVSQTTIDDYAADIAITGGGSAGNPIAIVGYPGATATIGIDTVGFGLRTPAIAGNKDHVVLAELVFRGGAAIDLVNVDDWRVVANDFSCPQGSGQSACFHTDTATNLKYLGNNVHNVGDQNGAIDKFYHAVYFTTNSNGVEAAWNTIAPNPTGSTTQGGCRAMQFFSTGGSDQFDLHVHDNLIHDAICDGINFSTVNPNAGTVEAYNNIVYHVGTGPTPSNGGGQFTCITINGGSGGTAAAVAYNNTLYDCGAMHGTDAGAVYLGIKTVFTNNLVAQLSGEVYSMPSGGGVAAGSSGTTNLWNGGGTAPTFSTGNITSAPLLVNTATADFHLQSTSPAKDAGTTVASVTTDFDGNSRPQNSIYDIGAYEYVVAGAASGGSVHTGLNSVSGSAKIQ